MKKHNSFTSTLTTGRKGFTLIELLVVISIIAILAAILFPVFAKAKRAASQVVCLSNMKQLTLAVKMYMGDHDGGLPGVMGPDSWNPYFYCIRPDAAPYTIELHGGTMRPYFAGNMQGANAVGQPDNLAQSQLIVCPDWKADQYPKGGPYTDSLYGIDREMEKYMSYGGNSMLGYANESQMGSPTTMIVVCETYKYPFAEYPSYIRPAWRHGNGTKGSFGFADGHAKLLDKAQVWKPDNGSWTMWRLDAKP